MGIITKPREPSVRPRISYPTVAAALAVGVVGFVIGRATAPPGAVELPVVQAEARAPRRNALAESILARAAPTQMPEPAPQLRPTPQLQTFEIVSIDTRVTESNSSWSRYSWRLVLKNLDSRPHLFNAKIEFQDSQGFIIDDHDQYNLAVPALAEETFTGYELVGADVRDSVARTEVKLRLKQ